MVYSIHMRNLLSGKLIRTTVVFLLPFCECVVHGVGISSSSSFSCDFEVDFDLSRFTLFTFVVSMVMWDVDGFLRSSLFAHISCQDFIHRS